MAETEMYDEFYGDEDVRDIEFSETKRISDKYGLNITSKEYGMWNHVRFFKDGKFVAELEPEEEVLWMEKMDNCTTSEKERENVKYAIAAGVWPIYRNLVVFTAINSGTEADGK